ncbi:hypothetical protein K503DRAFT_806884 [Rhizopogon vinicolor AM-OR11-026]|uniref:Uncharacterized protein n=1 Tax=Rhizopogon vinicolor AM-OR11-026 TaxID=1314800 RepID=A0A1B7MDK2_9AGAM|nr:hypothetical protein K503DRAFT_806884 [Rhizopogon vinicolor AM-OR11-026]
MQFHAQFHELFPPSLPSLKLTDKTLQNMAQMLHDAGSKLMSEKAHSTTPPSAIDVLVHSQVESYRVNTVLIPAVVDVSDPADLDTNTAIAMTMTQTLVMEARNKAEGFVVSHWSKDVCPWLYSPSDEVGLVRFLNQICSWVNQHLMELGAIKPHNSDDPHRYWIRTGNTLFQARSGVAASSKTSGTGARKPDVTLVTSDSHEWSDVICY